MLLAIRFAARRRFKWARCLGKYWTLPDSRKRTLRVNPICIKFEYGSKKSRPCHRSHFHCRHGYPQTAGHLPRPCAGCVSLFRHIEMVSPMHVEHKGLRSELGLLSGSSAAELQGAYTRSPHIHLGVSTPELRRVAMRWLRSKKSLPAAELLVVADSLFSSSYHDEKTLGALIIGYSKAARTAATPERMESWLDHLIGWAEIDALCSNAFQAEDFLDDWPTYDTWLTHLAADPNINKRRGSLVLLTGPVRRSADPRLSAMAFANLRSLQREREILITKAVSWLLRSLIHWHRQAVVQYLDANRAELPAIAIREISTKLRTGTKSGKTVRRLG